MITINAGQSTSFPRIADAIEAAKAYAPMPVTIHIAPGRYHEKLTISQPHVTLMGDDASNTILTYDDYAREIMPDGIKRGTFRTYTLFLDAPDITLCNLTVENAAGAGKEVGQAILEVRTLSLQGRFLKKKRNLAAFAVRRNLPRASTEDNIIKILIYAVVSILFLEAPLLTLKIVHLNQFQKAVAM
mgnify:CR=1 FL=1